MLEYVINGSTNKEYVLFGTALKYASTDLQNDYEVVLAAVSQHGFALEFASQKCGQITRLRPLLYLTILIGVYFG